MPDLRNTPLPAALVAPDAKVTVAAGVCFLEGPAVHADGSVYVSDIAGNRILRMDAEGKVSTFRADSGRTNGNDTINGGAGNDVIYGQEGNDTIDGGAGDDLISGGTGRDVLTGGTGTDTFVFNAGESRATVGGSNDNGTITGHDRITDFNTAADILNLVGVPVAGTTPVGGVNGTNSALTVSGAPVRSHSITNGVITFDDNDSFSTALTLSSDARVAAVVDYLQRNDLGAAGTTVAFVAGTRTFVYQQVGATQNPANDILVELTGTTITNLTTLIGSRSSCCRRGCGRAASPCTCWC